MDPTGGRWAADEGAGQLQAHLAGWAIFEFSAQYTTHTDLPVYAKTFGSCLYPGLQAQT